MFNYDLICKNCGHAIQNPQDTDYRWEDGQRRFPYCPICNNIMCNGVLGIAPDGDYEHISQSLAINPLDIEEHRKHWPNIEALPDGRLKFKSVREQEQYAHHFGLDKKEARRR
jgi:hypothetical protein